MKRNSIFSGRMVACAAALAVLGLSSCQSALYKAAERGDVGAVQQALAGGATVKDKNEAADVAYKKGHTAVLEELVKAGAAVSPESVAKMQIVMKWESEADEEEFNPSDNTLPEMNADNFDKLWKTKTPLQWHKGKKHTILVWEDSNKREKSEESAGTDDYSYYLMRYSHEYKKTGVDKAYIAQEKTTDSNYRGRMYLDGYELIFATPTSGTCRHVGESNFNEYFRITRASGRFWLRDESNPAVIFADKAKSPAKKQSVKKKKSKKRR